MSVGNFSKGEARSPVVRVWRPQSFGLSRTGLLHRRITQTTRFAEGNKNVPLPVLPDTVTALSRMGIDLLPPRNDEIERIVRVDKGRLPRRAVRTPNSGVTLGRLTAAGG